MTIKPVSDLRNYNTVLRECAPGKPVFLTKNGRDEYVIIDAKDYKKSEEERIKNDIEWQHATYLETMEVLKNTSEEEYLTIDELRDSIESWKNEWKNPGKQKQAQERKRA